MSLIQNPQKVRPKPRYDEFDGARQQPDRRMLDAGGSLTDVGYRSAEDRCESWTGHAARRLCKTHAVELCLWTGIRCDRYWGLGTKALSFRVSAIPIPTNRSPGMTWSSFATMCAPGSPADFRARTPTPSTAPRMRRQPRWRARGDLDR